MDNSSIGSSNSTQPGFLTVAMQQLSNFSQISARIASALTGRDGEGTVMETAMQLTASGSNIINSYHGTHSGDSSPARVANDDAQWCADHLQSTASGLNGGRGRHG